MTKDIGLSQFLNNVLKAGISQYTQRLLYLSTLLLLRGEQIDYQSLRLFLGGGETISIGLTSDGLQSEV